MASKKKAVKKAATKENPALTKILDEVHVERPYHGFIDRYAEFMSVTNMGHDPVEEHFQDFLCEAEAASWMMDEKRGWMRVAKAIVVDLKKTGKPLTIREAEKVWNADSKKLVKLYAKK